MFGTYLASQAARYLGTVRSQPFFLYVSFYETHSPFWFPVEYRGRQDPRCFQVPPVSAEDRDRLPPVFRELTEANKQGIQAAYTTSAEFLDRNVGRVLEALDRSPCAGNTLVLFTSDHGYLLGQHGRFEKHCCFEPAVRSALLLRLPRANRPRAGDDGTGQPD
jgi:choline-sulfatase